MAELKTTRTDASVDAFLGRIADDGRRKDCKTLVGIMRRATSEKPAMWGAGIVGFGSYQYTYASGRTGEWPIAGFAPRKQDLVLYIMPGFTSYDALIGKLGKIKTGKSCLYVKRLADVDIEVLERLVQESVKDMKKRYP